MAAACAPPGPRPARARPAPRRRRRIRASAAPLPPSPAATPSLVALGESLFDATPGGLFLGGAPLNVAAHAAALGLRSALATRVGADDLGDEVLLRLREKGVDTRLVQRDGPAGEGGAPTGYVRVTFAGSEPTYDIRQPSAWDRIAATPELLSAAAAADVLVFGTLAQRSPAARAAVRACEAAARRAAFDVNFRHPFDGDDVLRAACDCAAACWLLKLNAAEAARLVAHGAPPAAAAAAAALPPAGLCAELGRRFGCGVALTMGSEGALLRAPPAGGRGGGGDGRRQPETWHHPGCRVHAVDAVGAGDAFLAALLAALLRSEGGGGGGGGSGGGTPGDALADANATGAFVATQRGATPGLDGEAIARLRAAAGPAVKL